MIMSGLKGCPSQCATPADESLKLAQVKSTVPETMWDRTGVLEKSGENVQAVSVAKRTNVKELGEPNPDLAVPAPVVPIRAIIPGPPDVHVIEARRPALAPRSIGHQQLLRYWGRNGQRP
jgi:hypothetical protein